MTLCIKERTKYYAQTADNFQRHEIVFTSTSDSLCIFCNLSDCITCILFFVQICVLYTVSEIKNMVIAKCWSLCREFDVAKNDVMECGIKYDVMEHTSQNMTLWNDVMKWDVMECNDVMEYVVRCVGDILPCNRIVVTVLSMFLLNIFIINQKCWIFITIIVSLLIRKYELDINTLSTLIINGKN